jgi:hypothetical protein
MSKSSSTSRRTALLVLGMHRSGTSALSGVLAKLGVESPKTLMPPTADNPKGYWESTAIMDFNNTMLASAGSRWDEWEAFNKDWVGTAAGKAAASRLPELLAEEFGDAPLFLVKDPRICRMLPAWLHGLAEADVAVKIVIPIRNPLEVAESLQTRNKLTRLQALLIWLRHVLDAEYDSRGQERVFARYADLLADWRSEVARIGKALDLQWPRMSGRTEAEIDAYLDRAMKHHTAEQKLPTGNAILAWVAEAHAAHCDLAEGRDGKAAEGRLDAVRKAFEAASWAFAPLFHEVRGDLTLRLEARSADVGRASAEAKELRAEIARLTQQRAADEGVVAKQKAELDALRNDLDGRTAAMRDLEAKHRSDRDELAAAQRELAAVSNEVIAAKAELAAADARARDAIADRVGLEETHKAQVAALNERLGERVKDLDDRKAKAESVATERLSEIVALSKRLLELEAAASAAQSELRGVNAELEKSRAAQKVQAVGLEAGRRRAEDQERRFRGLVAELSAQASVISDYRRTLEGIRASRRWALPGELRRLAGGAVEVGDAERPVGELEALLRRSKLFDAGWYLTKYQDVRNRKLDPVRHYLRYGANEGRDPGPAFSTKGYIARNPDVQAAGINPLVHYLVYGRKEGRSIATGDSKPGGKV